LVGLHRLYLGILLPGCALLLSAIIQAKTFGLSVYHGMIVLNLSWINNTSALIFFEFALIAQIKLDRERDFRRRVATMLKLVYESLDSGDTYSSDVLTVAGSRIQRLRSALEVGVTNPREDFKLEGSKEILENIIQGLKLLGVHVNSLKGAVAAVAEREAVAKREVVAKREAVAKRDVANASEALKKRIMDDGDTNASEALKKLIMDGGDVTNASEALKKLIMDGGDVTNAPEALKKLIMDDGDVTNALEALKALKKLIMDDEDVTNTSEALKKLQ